MLPKSISKSDVKVNGYKAEYVSILDSDSIRIEIPSGADGDNYIKLEFSSSAGIVNPSTPGKSYYYTVEYDSKEYKSKDVEITGASNAVLRLLVRQFGRSEINYTFDIDLASKLYSNTEIQVEFPNWEMVPPVITNSNVTVNGDQVTGLSVNGNKVFSARPAAFPARTA